MEGRSVCYVASLAFGGSSLANVLLDTQPTIRGMGERHQVRPDGGPCATCQTTTADCSLYGGMNPATAWRDTLDHYADCRVLVDSSKSIKRLAEYRELEPTIPVRVLLLYKPAISHAYSLLRHWELPPDIKYPEMDRAQKVLLAVEAWVGAYGTAIAYLRESGLASITVNYEDLAGARVATVRRICDWLGEPFDDNRLRGEWWRTDTHILGGNPAVVASVSGNESLSFHGGAESYLGGKYADGQRKIFVDRSWRRDREYVELFQAARRKFADKLRRIGSYLESR